MNYLQVSTSFNVLTASKLAAFAAGVLYFAISFPLAAEPSFDCSKAKMADELAICSNPGLSELDRTVARGYQLLTNKLGTKNANRVHLPFLKARRACAGDVVCIFQQQIAELPSLIALDKEFEIPAWVTIAGARNYDQLKRAMKIGDCVVSTISEITYRLCDSNDDGVCIPMKDSGSVIRLANGIDGISYEAVSELQQAEYGDAVLACLSSIPTDCPPGDDRGFFWTMTDLRTNLSWELPDSPHLCGGA